MPVIVGVEPIKGLIFDQKIDTQWGDMTRIKLNQYLASLEAIPRREQQEETVCIFSSSSASSVSVVCIFGFQ